MDALYQLSYRGVNGAGSRTRTYEARSARDLQSLVIATRRFQQLNLLYQRFDQMPSILLVVMTGVNQRVLKNKLKNDGGGAKGGEK